MNITLSPIRSDVELTLSKRGETLIINGEDYDLSAIPEGATLPQSAVDCSFLSSDILRNDGTLAFTLILPHGANAPSETLFPTDLALSEDGPVALPPYDAPTKDTLE